MLSISSLEPFLQLLLMGAVVLLAFRAWQWTHARHVARIERERRLCEHMERALNEEIWRSGQ